MTREELRQAILSAPIARRTTKPVATPEWPAIDGQVFVRSLTLPERTKYLGEIRKLVLSPDVLTNQNGKAAEEAVDVSGVKLVVLTMCTEDGEQLMEESDVEILALQSWSALNRVVDVSADLNGLTKQSLEKAKNVSPSAVTSSTNTVSH